MIEIIGKYNNATEAKNTLSVEDFKNEMKGIFTTCIENSMLDESPMACKGIDYILSQIEPTVT